MTNKSKYLLAGGSTIDAYMLKIPACFGMYLVYEVNKDYPLKIILPYEKDVTRGKLWYRNISAVLFSDKENKYYAYTGKYEKLQDIVDLYVVGQKTLPKHIFHELFIEVKVDYTKEKGQQDNEYGPGMTFASIDVGKLAFNTIDVDIVYFKGNQTVLKTFRNITTVQIKNPIKQKYTDDPWMISYSLDEKGLRTITLRDLAGRQIDLINDLGDYDALYLPAISVEKPIYVKKNGRLEMGIDANEIFNKLETLFQHF